MIGSVAASGAGLSAYSLTQSAASTSSASTQAAASGQKWMVTPAEAGLGDLTDADWKLVSASVGKDVGPDASGKIQGTPVSMALRDTEVTGRGALIFATELKNCAR